MLWCSLGLKVEGRFVSTKLLESLSSRVGKFRLGNFPAARIQIVYRVGFSHLVVKFCLAYYVLEAFFCGVLHSLGSTWYEVVALEEMELF